METIRQHWKRLIPEHRDYTFIYSTAILWGIAYYSFVPPTALGIIDRIVFSLWIASTILGAGLALYGLLKKDNLLVERLGVIILLPTPLIYSAVQIAIVVVTFANEQHEEMTWQPRIAMAIMGLWLFAFVNKRRRQLKRRVTDLKNAPAAKNQGTK